MKKLLMAILILASACCFNQAKADGIVTATATRDSVSLYFTPLDSMGKGAALASGDSIYLVVFSPGGDVVYKDSMAYNGARVKSYAWQTSSIAPSYILSVRIDSINGTSTSKGVFTYILTVLDKTGASLTSTFAGQFQVVDTTLDLSLNRVRNNYDSLVQNSIRIKAILDSIQLYDGRWALASELVKAIDSINAILDTIQLYDGRYALAAELTKVIDSLNVVIDSINAGVTAADLAATVIDTGIARGLAMEATVAAIDPPTTSEIYDVIAALFQDSSAALRDSINVLHLLSIAQRDSINAILDSLQLYDGRYALASELTKSIDSINAILDTLQLYDGRYALASELTKAVDSLNAILDTLQNNDNWAAKEATSLALVDSLTKQRKVIDSIQTELLKAADSIHIANVSLVATRDSLHQIRLRADSILSIVLDSAKFGRQVWDNDIVALALRTILLPANGLDGDSSFTALQAQMAKVVDSLQAALDSLQLSDDHYRSLLAQIDTLGMYGINKLVSKSITAYHDDRDTVWYINGTDTMFYDVYYHVGGAEGNPPDSVKRTAM
jgi:hypothetical protein